MIIKKTNEMTYEERLDKGKKLKEKGVELFKEGNITSARDLFSRAIIYLENMDRNNKAGIEGLNLYAITLSNLCNCYNKQKEYDAVANFATKGLKIKELPKLYYFRSIAYANIYELDLARRDLEYLKNLLAEKEREKDEDVKYVNQLIENKKAISNKINLTKEIFLKNRILVSPPKQQNKENPIVFFYLEIGNKLHKRIEIELFKDKAPIISEYFRCLCTGEKSEKMHFKEKAFHRVIKNFIIEGGYIKNEDNDESSLLSKNLFEIKDFFYSHNREGLLSKAIKNKDRNSFEFSITLKDANILDKTNIVFGQVLKGMEVVKEIEKIETDSQNKPKTKVIISNCGEIKNGKEIIIKNNKEKQKEEEKKAKLIKTIYKNEINIIYKITNKENKIRIFSDRFVKNNYLNCKIIFKGTEYNLVNYYIKGN